MRTDKQATTLKGFWDTPRPELLELLHATPAGLTSDETQRRLRLHGGFDKEDRNVDVTP